MTDFTSRMNIIHEHNFGSNKTQNISSIYNSNNIIYYNTTTYNTPPSYRSTVIHANNIPLWFSQQHCKITG